MKTTVERKGADSTISQETVDGIIRAIAENFSPKQIILFGSCASENITADSDIDLLIVMDTELPHHKRATPIRLLFRPMPCAMDIFVYTPEEVSKWKGTPNHIITEAMCHGKKVYGE